MSTAREQYYEALDLPIQESRAALHRAADTADAENDLDLAHEIRLRLISNSHGTMDPLPMMAAFGWCLARHDEDPERFPLDLWYYKWVTNHSIEYPAIGRSQLTELHDDMTVRYTARSSPAPALKEKARMLVSLGDLDEAADVFDAWQEAISKPRRYLNDCPACDDGFAAATLDSLGRPQDAVDASAALFNGPRRCATQPHYAYARALQPARRAGHADLADEWHHTGFAMIQGNSDFHDAHGDHVRHMAVTGQVEKALRVVATVGEVDGSPGAQLRWLRGARLALAAAAMAGMTTETAPLRARVDGRAEAIASTFDARNGNTSTSDLLTADDAELAAAQSES